jgi:membrane protease YdiL (CAAX protease family)
MITKKLIYIATIFILTVLMSILAFAGSLVVIAIVNALDLWQLLLVMASFSIVYVLVIKNKKGE